jgi:hypothetical protein
VDLDAHARFSKDDFVSRLKTDAARAVRDRYASAFPHDRRPLRASIVHDAVVVSGRVVSDMRVSSGHAVVGGTSALSERNLVRPDQATSAVPHLDAPAEVDARRTERVCSALRRTVDDGKVDSVGSVIGLVNVRSWRNASELQLKIG